MRCANDECVGRTGFLVARGQSVLIDFSRSIFKRTAYSGESGSVLPRDSNSSMIGRFLRTATYGSGAEYAGVVDRFTGRLFSTFPAPLLLIVGGGTIGEGLSKVYRQHPESIVGIDAYASDQTALVCDAHDLPFQDDSFDGVIIQAVLEHVLDPARVADEIHRVLKPGGLVLADTPFMQQVHEGAYDFTRFSKGGHRWLFRRFDEVESGVSGGPGVALLWSISYFVRALGAGPRMTAIIAFLFAWVRPLERLMNSKLAADAASATYFVGAKSAAMLSPDEVPGLYDKCAG